MQISNLPDIRNHEGKWVRSYLENGVQCVTRAGVLWHNVEQRCNNSIGVVSKFPTYLDCINGFRDFQDLAEWCQSQYGYMFKESNGRYWSLDKDLYSLGNKLYSPDTCCFIPNEINSLFTYSGNNRGKYSLGVSFDYMENRFRARGSLFGKRLHLGYFDNQNDAHVAWQRHKIHAIRETLKLFPNLPKRTKDFIDNHAKLIENDILTQTETVR